MYRKECEKMGTNITIKKVKEIFSDIKTRATIMKLNFRFKFTKEKENIRINN